MTEILAPTKARLAAAKTREAIVHAMIANQSAKRMLDPITPVPNKAGVLPPASLHFPANRKALRKLTGPQLRGLLKFYGEAVPRTIAARRDLLCVIISLVSPEDF